MRPSMQLRRNVTNRRFAGVAAGLSDFFGIDVTLIRVLLTAGAIFSGGTVLVIYLICWAIIPPAATGAFGAAPANAPQSSTAGRRAIAWLIGIGLLLWIVLIAARDHGNIIFLIIAAVVGLFVWRQLRGRKSWRTRQEFEKARLAWQRRLDEQRAQSAPPPYPGVNPFQIGSFYPQSPPTWPQTPPGVTGTPNPPQPPSDPNQTNPNSGFQIQ